MMRTMWTGRWIWAPERVADVRLRRGVELKELPTTVPARVTADSRYVLRVNGAEVSRGPVRSNPDLLAYHEADLAPYLRIGSNVVEALVRFYGSANRWWRPADPVGALGYGSFLFDAPAIDLFSDASWLASTDDGSEWTDAVELADPEDPPFTAMEPSEMAELTALPRDARLVVRGDGFSTLDIGEMTHGTVVVTMDARPGTTVDLSVGEDLAGDGRALIEPRRWTERCTAVGGEERFESFDPIGFRYLTVTTSADVRRAGVVERRYPAVGTASFSCDDDRLTRIWSVGARTLELCALDAFVDCPGREQNSWIGDSYIHTLVAMVTNSDWRLIRRNLRLGAQSRRRGGLLSAISTGGATVGPFNIPEYSLHWIRALCRYVERSGDVATARELLPAATDVIDAFERHRGDDGLLRSPPIVFVDWAQTERGSVTAAIDALFAAAVLDHAFLLEVAGDHDGAARSRTRHRRTADALEHVWDDERGVYVDALHDERGPGRRVSQQTNALAIVGRCAPESRWSSMLDVILDADRVKRTLSNGDLPEDQHWSYQRWDPEGFDAEQDVVLAQPFMAHFLHQAMANAGRVEQLSDSCKRWWPQIERGNTTFEEFWSAPPGTASRCHAWSATPTYDLTTHVLGVHPVIESAADIGFRRVAVSPSFGRLQHVAGRVPTPHGELEVDLRPTGGTVVVPEGIVEVAVRLPEIEPCVFGPGTHRVSGSA